MHYEKCIYKIIYIKIYFFILIKIAIDKKINKAPTAISMIDNELEIPKALLSTPEVVVFETEVDCAFEED